MPLAGVRGRLGVTGPAPPSAGVAGAHAADAARARDHPEPRARQAGVFRRGSGSTPEDAVSLAQNGRDSRVPFFDVADPAFSVSSAEVHSARESGWYARTSYRPAGLRYDPAARTIRHPGVRQ